MAQKTPEERRKEEMEKRMVKSLTPVKADGDEIIYEAKTVARCDHCGPSKPKAQLALLQTTGNTEILVCMNCDRAHYRAAGWHKKYLVPEEEEEPGPEAA